MLNDYYQNVGMKGFFKRYGVVNALRRGAFMANRIHFVQDYEMRKVLWQKKASKKVDKYMKYQDTDPSGLVFPGTVCNDPIWIYWDQGMENAPDLVRKCYHSVLRYHSEKVILLTNENVENFIQMPDHIQEKLETGSIPLAVYTDLMRVALIAHYGGTWIDATVYLTSPIPDEILKSDFFAFQNSMGLVTNPALYPVWFIHAAKGDRLLCRIRNVLFAHWKNEKHLTEYLFSNLIFTKVIHCNQDEEKKIPYMNSDYSEYLVRILGEDYSVEKWEWIKKLTGIHKLTYKLSPDIDRPASIYRHIMAEPVETNMGNQDF